MVSIIILIVFLVAGLGAVVVLVATPKRRPVSRPAKEPEPEVIRSVQTEPTRRPRRILRRMFGELRPYGKEVFGTSLILLASIPLTLLTPFPIKIIVDSVLGSQPLPGYLTAFIPGLVAQPVDVVVLLAIAMLLAIMVLTNLQNLLVVWSTTRLGNKITLNMRARLFRAMQRLSISYHDSRGTADSSYSVQYDAPSVQWFAINDLLPNFTAVFTLVGMVLVTYLLDPELALIASVIAPALFIITMVYRRRMRMRWRTVKASESEAMSVVHESLTSLRIVKAFGQEERENERFVDRFSQSASANNRAQWEGGVYNLLIGIVTASGLAAVLFVGIQHVQSGVLSLGSLLVVNAYILQLYAPVKTIGSNFLDMEKSFAGMERFFAIVDRGDDVPEKLDALPVVRAKGALAFDRVTFEYEEGRPVLHDVSFEVKPGSCLGIVGPTGSGKSTMVNLMLRFFDPTGGKVILDGVDLRDYRLKDLRNQFGVVLQETLLFSTTVAENIRFAKPEATMEEVAAAARAANAHDFISRLPDGYDTLVGEKGMKLSGGERQRISLARAFLKDAPILILDEPTSSLDVFTEAAVMDAVGRLMQGRTSVMVAHRASTLKNCDAIVMVEDGRVKKVTTEVAAVLQGMLGPGASRTDK
jgi:ATP-binding cassette subfamily B protein